VVLRRLTEAEIDAAVNVKKFITPSVKQVITARMNTGGVAPRKTLWKNSKVQKISK
jgi:hypothetical protein